MATPAVPPSAEASSTGGLPRATLALRLLQVMVAAAHADGTLDAEEEQGILTRLQQAELTQEEKLFFVDELQHPKSIEALTAGITDQSTARNLYMMAVAAIVVDSDAERAWLDALARQLGLSAAVQGFLEQQVRGK